MLPIADRWFRSTPIADGLVRIDEPHTHLMVAANIWHARGRDRDLVFDTGLGVGSLRAECPALFDHDPVVVVSHGHLDHIGGAHEFDGVCTAGAENVDHVVGTLDGREFSAGLGLTAADWEPDGIPDLLIDAIPSPGYEPRDYRIQPPRVEQRLADGDIIDLGDHAYTVLLLPGHTPGSLALLEERTGALFSGDVVYDDVLLDSTVGANPTDYVESLKRLVDLPVDVVHPGHGHSFTGERLGQIIRDYVRLHE